MTQTEVMRQAAILRAAVDMAKASKGALSKDQEEAILTDAIGAGLDPAHRLARQRGRDPRRAGRQGG